MGTQPIVFHAPDMQGSPAVQFSGPFPEYFKFVSKFAERGRYGRSGAGTVP